MGNNVDTILKMVEEKKITAEEAIKLLNSLETEKNKDTNNTDTNKESTVDSIKIELEEGIKKIEKGFKKIEPTVEKTLKEALLKVSELTGSLADKIKDDEKEKSDDDLNA